MNKATKQFGLIIPKKSETHSIKNVFNEESGSDPEETSKNWLELSLKTKKKQTRIDIARNLEDDPTVYQYDEVYDDIQKKKAETEKLNKPAERKPKYIQQLLAQANRRKKENERRIEKQIQKERDAEGDEFADKESFVTPSYKKKLEEMRLFDEEEIKLGMLEDIADVSKQNDMTGFYRHLYRSMTSDGEHSSPAGPSKTEISDKANETVRDNGTSSDSGSSSDDETDGNRSEENTDSSNSVHSVSYKRKLTSHDKEVFHKRAKNDTRQYRKYKEQSPAYQEENMKGSKIRGKSISKPKDVSLSSTKSRPSENNGKDKNLDSDTSLSSTSSDEEEEKVGIKNDSSKSRNRPDEKDRCIVDKSDEMKSKSCDENSELEKCVTDVKTESMKKEKINIWAKRTVGLLFEEALERYLKRKSNRIATKTV